jgi:hypothetical protein
MIEFRSRWPLLALALLFVPPAVARAERFPVKITNVRLGLPPGPFSKERDENNQPVNLFKAATWAPVWVELEVIESINQPTIEIRVETPDGDDVISSARISVATPQSGKHSGLALGRIPYLKPGGIFTEVTVSVRGADGKPLAETFQKKLVGMPPARHLFLSLGASLPGLRLPKSEGQTGESGDADSLRNGWVELAEVTNVRDFPDLWIGFAAVDLMIIGTAADPSFFKELAGDSKRRKALHEWVKRGGQVIISAGANPELLNSIPEFKEILPARLIGAKRAANEIPIVLPNTPRLLLQPPARDKIAIAGIEKIPERPYLTKLMSDERVNASPLVVQASHGLGRVTLVTFDLDVPPFADWRHREVFWEWLVNLAGTHLPSGTERATTESRSSEGEDEYLTRMQNNLEFFEGVPVISFSWVALLILAYILVIGPAEYYLVKKIFKRQELTWITFPIIVAGTCAAAYFIAHDLKGRELRVNKIDLVEIDLGAKRVYGETWFTIFSPRIENYTIGVEPASGWSPDGPEYTRADTFVSWHGKAKSSRQSLFRRTYSYHAATEPDAAGRLAFADGLEQVPIQVWSTKSFTASWSARLDPERPLIESTLRISAADPNQITGSITSNLPIEMLTDAQLIYRERIVPLPPLMRGVPRYISTSGQAAAAATWLQSVNPQKDLVPSSRSTGSGSERDDDPMFRIWPVLFHELMQGHHGRQFNASVRSLDQSWRVGEQNNYEAILVARIGRTAGPAEQMSNSPNSPTRLWLGELPGSGVRTPLTGTIRQETYIRVFIPVLPVTK